MLLEGKGYVGQAPGEILSSSGIAPYFEFTSSRKGAFLDYIHRSCGNAEIYFVANRNDRGEETECTFRVSGKAPELWDAVTGERRDAAGGLERRRRPRTSDQTSRTCGRRGVRRSLSSRCNVGSGRVRRRRHILRHLRVPDGADRRRGDRQERFQPVAFFRAAHLPHLAGDVRRDPGDAGRRKR